MPPEELKDSSYFFSFCLNNDPGKKPSEGNISPFEFNVRSEKDTVDIKVKLKSMHNSNYIKVLGSISVDFDSLIKTREAWYDLLSYKNKTNVGKILIKTFFFQDLGEDEYSVESDGFNKKVIESSDNGYKDLDLIDDQ